MLVAYFFIVAHESKVVEKLWPSQTKQTVNAHEARGASADASVA